MVPMRTGLTLLEGVAASSGTADIATLMSHAEVALRVHCPGSFSFRIFFYMSIDGTTAWHAGAPCALPRPHTYATLGTPPSLSAAGLSTPVMVEHSQHQRTFKCSE